MAERHEFNMTLLSGRGISVVTGNDGEGCDRVAIGSEPWALVLDPQDALALSVLIDRACRAIGVPR